MDADLAAKLPERPSDVPVTFPAGAFPNGFSKKAIAWPASGYGR